MAMGIFKGNVLDATYLMNNFVELASGSHYLLANED